MSARIVGLMLVSSLLAGSTKAVAQQRLLDLRTISSGAIGESWWFGGAKATSGAESVISVSQLSIPLTAVVPLASNWALDSYTAYAVGAVMVDRGETEGRVRLSLSGLTDTKLRLVGRLHGDNMLLVLGASVPTGTTALDSPALEALSVLASPALRFRTPTLGTGPSGTGGLVIAREVGSWALAAAGSFEKRGNYAPAEALVAGLDEPTLKAGDAIHLSIGADRFLKTARQSVSLIADLYTNGELRDPEAAVSRMSFRLGPTVTATYQLQGTIDNVEAMLYLLQRFRGNYAVAGEMVAGSWRSESEVGLANAIPIRPQLSFRVGIDSRFHTAARVGREDQTIGSFATSGMIAGGATLGAQYVVGGGALLIEPFVRGQIGRLDVGGLGRRATGASAGLTLETRF